VPYDSVTTI